jgi:hypothetical protein
MNFNLIPDLMHTLGEGTSLLVLFGLLGEVVPRGNLKRNCMGALWIVFAVFVRNMFNTEWFPCRSATWVLDDYAEIV